jgi:hypothetical protein
VVRKISQVDLVFKKCLREAVRGYRSQADVTCYVGAPGSPVPGKDTPGKRWQSSPGGEPVYEAGHTAWVNTVGTKKTIRSGGLMIPDGHFIYAVLVSSDGVFMALSG